MRPVIVMTQTSEFKKNDTCILHMPFIDVEPLLFDLSLLENNYDWLIFSSKNAVKYFYPYLSKVSVSHIAVIGEKTAEYCHSLGIKVDFCPDDYSQEGFLKTFKAAKNSHILIPSSASARTLLQNTLAQQPYKVRKIDLYQPIPHTENIIAVKRLMRDKKIDAVTFASSSAVRYFFENNDVPPFDNYFVIGQQTLETLEQYNICATIADIQTLESLVKKTLESWKDNAI
ncbi:uroporphyrinogen-III synthase [Staphylococcus succinus]|jgi:uroporphyrinogen-III synthase|uniref:uroporphyrinogen-III synthase n=1 Tax=Staphylococcus succinus TaxID=61015 RepID=UPI0009362459|nr:uroporphyrinogen-III synthase [Staphylococcus succinus]MEB8209158.1 uroporphyrinogen-III synthase [Staphylococcus succinus]PTI38788.1 uroporphyrinogen III synthase [Staphylococcus succinus]PTJ17798.1 uroporphyrinogen III synthase [Staphylococcus succinus]RIN25043.1 uroporphyrinogen-III synthase [Staphylococcus succinus]RIN33243.1 uroporphyrinogen-III synthase [Staphylococcus succinus]